MAFGENASGFDTFHQNPHRVCVLVDPVADSSVAGWIVALVGHFWPDARIRIDVGRLPPKVTSYPQPGEPDFCLKYCFQDEINPEFAYQVLFEDPLVVLVPETHTLAKSKTIKMEALREERWILPSARYMPYVRRVLLWEALRAGFSATISTIRHRAPFVDALAGGCGLSLAPSGFLHRCPPQIVGVRLDNPAAIPFAMVYRARENRTAILHLLMKIKSMSSCQQLYKGRANMPPPDKAKLLPLTLKHVGVAPGDELTIGTSTRSTGNRCVAIRS